MLKPTKNTIETVELHKMQQELLQILIDADPFSNEQIRENLYERIQRLRYDDVIPDLIGDFMHIVRKSRNRAEYQGVNPQGMEALAIQFAWYAIEEWHIKCNVDVTKNAKLLLKF